MGRCEISNAKGRRRAFGEQRHAAPAASRPCWWAIPAGGTASTARPRLLLGRSASGTKELLRQLPWATTFPAGLPASSPSQAGRIPAPRPGARRGSCCHQNAVPTPRQRHRELREHPGVVTERRGRLPRGPGRTGRQRTQCKLGFAFTADQGCVRAFPRRELCLYRHATPHALTLKREQPTELCPAAKSPRRAADAAADLP